ncbi:MAG TPA: glycosyltransferase family 4 protein [Burkholderiales bacterium]|nr:glycosyltransferase family 4 protein [Burkholderiales bacterium]
MAVLLALMISVLAVRLFSGSYAARLAMDLPNQRSLHTVPIPRTGGLGVATGVACGWALAGAALPVPVWAGAAALIAVSFLDDRYGLPAAARFLVHGVIAAWLALSLGINPGWAAVAVLLMVWMTNLYNFMDGADGLAGGMAVSGFGVYALVFAYQGEVGLGVASAEVAVAALGFLLFNFPPARVFMGDAGSIPLGFLAAAFGLLGIARQAWPVWFPLLVFAPFVLDATVTLTRRGLRGEKVWQAHKQHYYQRLIRMGWSHRRTALVEYGLMLASGAVAVLMLRMAAPTAYALGGLWLLLLAAGMLWTDRRWQSFAAAD